MNNLKFLRNEYNLSLMAVEIKTGIKANTYSRYENEQRQMSYDILKLLAAFYEVSIDFLLCNSEYAIYATDKITNVKYSLNIGIYTLLKKQGCIYYCNNCRYIDKIKIPKEINIYRHL